MLWVGTRNGLNRFDRATETFTALYQTCQYVHQPGSDVILSLYETARVFSGWYGGGHQQVNSPGRTFNLYATTPPTPSV